MVARMDAVDYHTLAEQHGFRWIGTSVINRHTKTQWACAENHEWEASYGSIHRGRGCPYCANRVLKTAGDYARLAASRDFIWLGPLTETTFEHTRWQCLKGHTWEAKYNSILSGHGCPECKNVANGDFWRLTSDDYHQFAQERGFVWLGPAVTRNNQKTWWCCSQGHKFCTTLNSISTVVELPCLH
jgi:hypothetical protein